MRFKLIEQAMKSSDAIQACYNLGRPFVAHFDKIYHDEDTGTKKHHASEMQAWLDSVNAIKLKSNNKNLSLQKKMDWFLTLGSDAESLFADSDEADTYDDFLSKLVTNWDVLQSLIAINMIQESLPEDFDVSYDDNKKRIKSGTSTYQRQPKYGVGKQMANQIYVHKNYATRVIDKDIYEKAVEMLNKKYPDFTFNTVMYDTKKPYTVRFDETKGFDREREPIVGNFIRVDLTKPFEEMFETGSTSQIFHHKWMWVDDDYKGFDVDKSYEWSKQWLSKIHKPSGYLDKWNKALDDAELERDTFNEI